MAIVKLFGAFAETAGWRDAEIDAATLDALRQVLIADHPGLTDRLDHPSTFVVLNGAILPPAARAGDRALTPTDEIAFGPPVSGG